MATSNTQFEIVLGASDDEVVEEIAIVGRALPAHLRELVVLLPLNEWVKRDVLELAYGRSNYARRIRKIVAEYGWDIQRERRSAGPNDDWYMRSSDGPVRLAHIRREVSPAVRVRIYERDSWICAVCRTNVSKGQSLTLAQCDHKAPAERGGPSTEINLQTLCLQCNLKKRQACKHCTLTTCDKCPHAFPEKFAQALVLKLSVDAAARLEERSHRDGVPAATFVERLLLGLND